VLVYGAGSDTDFSFRNARMDNFRDRVFFYTGLKLAHGVVVQNEYQKLAYEKKHRGAEVGLEARPYKDRRDTAEYEIPEIDVRRRQHI